MDEATATEEDNGFAAVLTEEAPRQRVIEYLGGKDLASVTCVHLARCDAGNPARVERHPVTDLDRLLRGGASVARSLYDTRSIIAHLDVEYVNYDAPMAAFTDPWRAFRLQEPVVRVIEELLSGWSIRPLHLITGQGHHFVWRFPRGAALERRFAHLFPHADPDRSEQVFANLGLVMEYLAHRIRERAQPEAAVPVEITALQVPPGKSGEREMVSIDISEYGDPLDARIIRVPFTRYLKPWRSGLARQLGVEGQIGPCVTIPLHEMDVMLALKCRQDPGDVASLARRCCTRIPEQTEGTGRLLDDYLRSSLRAFHQRFYEAEHDPREIWPATYGRTPLEEFPGCVRHVLTEPNDSLLKPAGMRLVTRCLLARGWHPRHIAGLVRSKFEDPGHGWADAWEDYSPGFRADFYVRLFAGQIAVGLDRLADFTCESLRGGGFCWPGDPPCDLRPFQEALSGSRSDPT